MTTTTQRHDVTLACHIELVFELLLMETISQGNKTFGILIFLDSATDEKNRPIS